MSIQQTLLKAQRCVKAGQYDAAIKHYRGLLRLTPKHPQVNNLLGTVLIQVGQPEAAAKVLQVALEAEPANPEYWIRLIAAYHRAGHVQRARELLPQGVAMGVDDDLMEQLHKSLTEPPALALQALNKLVQAGDMVSAEIAARMMVADYPDSVTAKNCLAMVIEVRASNAVWKLSDQAEPLEVAQATSGDVSSADMLPTGLSDERVVGLSAGSKKQRALAIFAFIFVQVAVLVALLALFLRLFNFLWRNTIASLEQALQAEPAVMGHWVRLLSAYQQSDNMARARDLLEEAIDVGLPAEPLQALAHAIQEPPQVRQEGLLKLYSQGSHLSTEIAARLLMDDYPSHPLGWQILGAVLHDAGKLQEALQVKTETVKLFPNDANAHNNLAFTLLALKQYAQAANSARRALMLSPSHAAAKANEAKAIALMKPVGVMRFWGGDHLAELVAFR